MSNSLNNHLHTTPEELLSAMSGCLTHHTSRFELLAGAPDDFIEFPAGVQVQCYDRPLVGWHTTLFDISDELYASIKLEKGSLQELVELLTKQTRAHKLGVLADLLAA